MSRPENTRHKHHPDAKAELFMSRGQGQTEDDFLELLSAVVRCCKPNAVIETGTYLADGSLAILNAMHSNGFGHLNTVEARKTNFDKGNARLGREAPPGKATYKHWHMPALQFINEDETGPYQLAFLDCDLATRHLELDSLISLGKLSPGAFVMIHDTSPLRLQRPHKVKAYQKGMAEILPKWDITERLEFPLSRGMTILRIP